MRKTFLVTSVIDVPNSVAVGATAFSKEERLNQTIYTLHSLCMQQPDAHIILCDGSQSDYSKKLQLIFPTIDYIYLSGLDPYLANSVRSGGKSLGESLLLQAMHKYRRDIINNSDFVVKLSGRYFFKTNPDKWFRPESLNNFLFCIPHKKDYRPWIDATGFNFSNIYRTHPNLNQSNIEALTHNIPEIRVPLNTVAFGCSGTQIKLFFEIVSLIVDTLGRSEYSQYDVEHLWPFFLDVSGLKSEVLYTDWSYCGWNSYSGRFVGYNLGWEDYALPLTI